MGSSQARNQDSKDGYAGLATPVHSILFSRFSCTISVVLARKCPDYGLRITGCDKRQELGLSGCGTCETVILTILRILPDTPVVARATTCEVVSLVGMEEEAGRCSRSRSESCSTERVTAGMGMAARQRLSRTRGSPQESCQRMVGYDGDDDDG